MPANLSSKLILAATLAWTQVLQLGPYVIGGILLAALLGQLDLPRRWGRWLNRSGPETVLGAACLGGVSPLCTYGTVPVLVELLRGGASPGPALAFLIASSLLNPQLFVMMTGGLGLRLALAHVAGVLLLSLPVGLLARRLRPETFLNADSLRPPNPSHTSTPPHSPPPTLPHTLLRLTETVGLYFVLGVILAALLQMLVPPEWISSLLGAGRWYGVLLAGILGVPFYACGGGAVPIIAGLLAQGMSPGAALAFFLAGPATRLTALAALGTLLNRRALIAYVAYVVAGAALAG
ncbi:MAG: permease, partial [Chloroflexi bacterium]|nr:permease [Chloroflexota bacterium]